jgi:hypothetical protein
MRTSPPGPRRYALARASQARKTFGRYDFDGARDPAGGRGTPARKRMVPLTTVAIDDPGELIRSESGRLTLRQAPKGRLFANVHRRVDILEEERAHSRISDSAYGVGRVVQAVFERHRGPSCGNQWRQGDRVDAWVQHELAIIYTIEDTRAIIRMVEKIRRAIGRVDANILQRVLAERRSFAQLAALIGRGGERGTRYVAQRFRDALEDLADSFGVKGKPKPRPVDKHDAAAAAHARRMPAELKCAIDAHRKLREEEKRGANKKSPSGDDAGRTHSSQEGSGKSG